MDLFLQKDLTPTKRKLELQYFLSFILLIILCSLSIRYFDYPVAVFMSKLHHSFWSLNDFNIAELLTNIVYITTMLVMLMYVACRFFGIDTPFVKTSGIISLAMAISFFIKSQTQVLFGRMAPLNTSFAPDNFHFMWGGCFPSGHMITFTCLLLLFTFRYPRTRILCYSLLAILAFLLIFDDYHFLSDVIAGAYLGVIIAIAIRYIFKIEPQK